jgi:hypothetical protein
MAEHKHKHKWLHFVGAIAVGLGIGYLIAQNSTPATTTPAVVAAK